MVESKNIADDLSNLKNEMADAKSAVLEIIKTSPDDLQAHRVYCAYVGKALTLEKLLVQARAMDPATILVGVLKCVVFTLIEKGEEDCARFVGQHLEEIEEKVKEKWPEFQEINLLEIITKSEPLSKKLPPSSEKHHKSTKGDA